MASDWLGQRVSKDNNSNWSSQLIAPLSFRPRSLLMLLSQSSSSSSLSCEKQQQQQESGTISSSLQPQLPSSSSSSQQMKTPQSPSSCKAKSTTKARNNKTGTSSLDAHGDYKHHRSSLTSSSNNYERIEDDDNNNNDTNSNNHRLSLARSLIKIRLNKRRQQLFGLFDIEAKSNKFPPSIVLLAIYLPLLLLLLYSVHGQAIESPSSSSSSSSSSSLNYANTIVVGHDGGNGGVGGGGGTSDEYSDKGALSRAALDLASSRDNDNRFGANQQQVNTSQLLVALFKKKPYSRYWSVEQKWDDLFKRALALQGPVKQLLLRNVLKDAQYYADLSLSEACENDLKYLHDYAKRSTNFRWLLHMLDAAGKSEPGMLTGNLAHLGHVIQCIKVRAPSRPSNDSFDERYFDKQTRQLGERFRGKYCLASIRPVLPPRPRLISRFNELMDESLLSNISFMGEPSRMVKQKAHQVSLPEGIYSNIDRQHNRLDEIPFESELYAYLIAQRNFMFTLPKYLGSCYPSSCSREDVRIVLQKTVDEQHQVVDVEFECEQEQYSLWEWLITPRLVCYVFITLIVAMISTASLARYILVDKMRIKRSKLTTGSGMANLLDTLEMLSMDKCAGILFVKTKPASPFVDWTKVENNRSTSIDALRGFLVLILIYSQLVVLGCLPIPFMWSKWADAMFPFFRSLSTQLFINMPIWTETFYIISAYLISIKFLENSKPRTNNQPTTTDGSGGGGGSLYFDTNHTSSNDTLRLPNFVTFAAKRYIRLVTPMLAFILLNYIWPQLSNGFVMQDQANKIMAPCDSSAWTNILLFHNHNNLTDTCLWPSHVSATFFQLHLISYPILLLCLMCLHSEYYRHQNITPESNNNINRMTSTKRHHGGGGGGALMLRSMKMVTYSLICSLALIGAIYPALKANQQALVVPFLIDYLDYDNYERVLEWMVLPTYNHLTGYMFGILIAFIVAQKRSKREVKSMVSMSDSWFYNNNAAETTSVINRECSLDSIQSSSTEGIVAKFHQHPNTTSDTAECRLKFTTSTCTSSSSSGHRVAFRDETETGYTFIWSILLTLVSSLVIFATLTASWLWNGLGQPMTEQQSFWYVMLTKILFPLAFGYIFYTYFAQRRNSNNPWMIIRFLVPIGRMSLSVFYVSWIVTWFDLLASLYQWHPSHYFIFEKFTEIIVITLILAMLVYGSFEGIIKRNQYAIRRARVERDEKYLLEMMRVNSSGQQQQQQQQQPELSQQALRRQQVKSFESFFDPIEKKMLTDDLTGRDNGNKQASQADSKLSSSTKTGSQLVGKLNMAQQQFVTPSTRTSLTPGRNQQAAIRGAINARSNLSPVDQCKLNAELRANYSFASIGLYESAGATEDLTQFHGSQSSFDPRSSSPAPSNQRKA